MYSEIRLKKKIKKRGERREKGRTEKKKRN